MSLSVPSPEKGTGGFSRGVPAVVRLVIALAVLGLFIRAFLFGGLSSNGILAPLVKGQFSAALYGIGIAGLMVIALLLLTLLFGRVYCSVLCPLGTLQELCWRAGRFPRPRGGQGRRPRRFFRSGYVPPRGIRYLVLPLAGLGAALAFSPLMMAADPLSTFGRGMSAVRVLAGGPGGGGVFALLIGLPLVLILVLAVFRGRAFCDWCPVGLTLGLVSSFAPFGPRFSSRCVSCGVCEKKCPAACVDSKAKRLDRGRCVLCLSCAASCPRGALGYGWRGKAPVEVDEGRRSFLRGAGGASLLCGAAYLLGPSIKTGAALLRSGVPGRSGGGTGPFSPPKAGDPILPPGAGSRRRYAARCVGCQACAASCPVRVLKVSGPPLQPALDYRDAGCQYNCVECGKVCPTGAIRPLGLEEKRRTRVALSSLFFERCVVNTRRESCGACAEVCPTGAIVMAPYGESGVPWLTRPLFEERYCIGCGACYAACPAEPRAFIITAAAEQTLTEGPRPPEEAGDALRVEETGDFPF